MSRVNWVILISLTSIGLALPSPSTFAWDNAESPSNVTMEQAPTGQVLSGQSVQASPNSVTLTQPGAIAAPPCTSCPMPQTASLDGSTFGACPLSTCCAVCGGGECCPDNFYIRQGVRILGYSKPRGVWVTLDYDPTTGTFPKTMSTRAMGYTGAAGYEATIGRYLGRDTDNRDQFIEFTYWGLNTWRGSKVVRGTRLTFGALTFGSLFTPFDSGGGLLATVGGFNRADEHDISAESSVNNYELNLRLRPRSRKDQIVLLPNGRWRRQCQPGDYLSYLFGLRLFSLDENFLFRSTGVIDDGGAISDVSGSYTTNSYNYLFGLQIGGDYIHRQCKWSYGFRIKVGPFVNFCDQATRVVTDAAGDPLATVAIDANRRARNDVVALVGEFGFISEYKIRPNFVLYAAYDFMWVTSLALAPEQLNFEIAPPNQINSNGDVYMHGLTLGLMVTW